MLVTSFARAKFFALTYIVMAGALMAFSSIACAQTAPSALPDAATLLKPGKPSGPQGDSWDSIKLLPDFTSTKWTGAPLGGQGGFAPCNFPPGVPPNPHTCLKLPFTPAYQKIFEKAKAISEAGGDVPSGRPRCIPSGYSGGLGGNRNALVEFLFIPGQIDIIPESWEGRRIYTDGRKHPADPDLTFSGDNIGHWEDGTLVVDTVGLKPQNEIAYGIPGGMNMHVVQRIRLIDPDTIEEISALEAPEALTAPRVSRSRLMRNREWTMHESYCTENNNDVNADGSQQFDLTPPPE